MMGDVYSTAQCVIAWLRRGGRDAQSALELQSRFVPTLQRFEGEGRWEDALSYSFDDPHFYEKFDMSRPSSVSWWFYAQFHRRKWFYRTWILQEIALAQEVLLICGSLRFEWSQTHLFGEFITRSGWGSELGRSLRIPLDEASPGNRQYVISFFQRDYREKNLRIEKLPSKDGQRDVVTAKESRHSGLALLERALVEARLTWSSDPRDKVYGIVGLVGKLDETRSNTLLQVDYGVSVVDVYTTVASVLLKSTSDLFLLSMVEDALERSTLELPSWVPDVSVSYPADFMLDSMRDKYDASGAVRDTSVSLCRIRSGVVYLEGLQYGSIAELCRRTDETVKSSSIHDFINLCSKLDSVYSSGQYRWEELWRTLIADQANGLCPAPIEFARHFHDWMLNEAVLGLRKARHLNEQRCRYRSWESFVQSSHGVEVPTLAEIDERALYVDETFETLLPFVFAQETKAHQRLFRTENNLLGLCPASSQVGDFVWLLQNANVFFILRPMEGSEHYKLVGETYLHGFMHGKIGSKWPVDFQQISIQ
ncbi:hypothetical protein OEA41_009718 [Lepraria neglecta]|uniref:Heterokaryon incompatibility domain-containing protein n=1 Tax=Lepraria neglecta TaxID=209136 RepID=A0AAD9Z3M8_9LECA|nr:hypothetical protein OEA41_009718 [Lepraria neglecta]